MALSCYSSSNWGELEHLNSDINLFAAEPDLSLDILGMNNYHNSFGFSDSYNIDDPCFASHDYFYTENYANHCNTLYSIFPENEHELYSSTKRQKGYDGCYINSSSEIDNGMMPSLCNSININGFVQNPPSLLPSEILSPYGSSFGSSNNNPLVFSSGSSGVSQMTNAVKKNGSGSAGGGSGTLSAQSIAARQRRRKITEKTQELGKLIPGGQKMNTAEMFQAAFKYIKFLQAQVGILESLAPAGQENGEFHNQELNPLLGSLLIQEKLYSTENCLVPKTFVESIANDNRLQSNPRVLKDFKELIGGGG